MQHRCEVCESYRPRAEIDATRAFVEVTFGARTVTLCRGHARIAANSGVTSFEQLREYYGSGRRSFVSRRGQSDVAERTAGRRVSDQRTG